MLLATLAVAFICSLFLLMLFKKETSRQTKWCNYLVAVVVLSGLLTAVLAAYLERI